MLWHEPDIFHIQWAKAIGEWIWVQEFGIKLILSLRGAHINYSPVANLKLADTYRNCFPQVDGFHAVSKAIGKEAQLYGAPSKRIALVYSGLDLSQDNNMGMHKSHAPFKIISVGRAHWKKGYCYALDACKLLKEIGFTFEYTIIGAANTIEYQYQIHDLGLDQQVTLLAKQPFERVEELMQEAHLLLLPSVEEGIANVVLEAMAIGTLVLTSNCGGMAEVITHGVNGFLVPIRDVQAMANRIEHIERLSHSERQTILKAAKNTIIEQHSEQQMVEGMLGLYHRVLNSELI